MKKGRRPLCQIIFGLPLAAWLSRYGLLSSSIRALEILSSFACGENKFGRNSYSNILVEAAATVAQSVKRLELRSLKEVQLLRC